MRHQISFKNAVCKTKQSFKDECDINKILKKFEKTGAIHHYATNAGNYGDTTQPQLHDALNIVANANTMFEELPATLRKKFNNDPGQFLEFVQNPKNLEEMRELGLAKQKAIPLAPTAADAKNPTAEAKPASSSKTKSETSDKD